MHTHIHTSTHTKWHQWSLSRFAVIQILAISRFQTLVFLHISLFFFIFPSFSSLPFSLFLYFFSNLHLLFSFLKMHGCQCHHYTPMPNNIGSLTKSSDPFIQEYIQTIRFYRLHLRYLLFQAHCSDQCLQFSHSLLLPQINVIIIISSLPNFLSAFTANAHYAGKHMGSHVICNVLRIVSLCEIKAIWPHLTSN